MISLVAYAPSLSQVACCSPKSGIRDEVASKSVEWCDDGAINQGAVLCDAFLNRWMIMMIIVNVVRSCSFNRVTVSA